MTLNTQRYRDEPTSIGRVSYSPAASSGEAWENKFLARRTKEKLNSLYTHIYM
jgi:hypothetical protein